MLWILDPAADVIWDSAGAIITAEGETDLSPTTDEGWEHVRNSAAVLTEQLQRELERAGLIELVV